MTADFRGSADVTLTDGIASKAIIVDGVLMQVSDAKYDELMDAVTDGNGGDD